MNKVALGLAVVAMLSTAGCIKKYLFRKDLTHSRTILSISSGQGQDCMMYLKGLDAKPVFDAGVSMRDAMECALRSAGSEGRAGERDLWCGFLRNYERLISAEELPRDQALSEARKELRKTYDNTVRERIEQTSRQIRIELEKLREGAPQNSMLALLEAHLFLLTGYSIDNWNFLLDAYDHDAAQVWYRRALERAQQTQELNRSYGASHLYEAQALAFLGRCPEAIEKVTKLHEVGYQTSSTNALLAHCQSMLGAPDKARPFLEAAIDEADSELSSSWASEYSRFLDEYQVWQRQLDRAEADEEYMGILDMDAPRELPEGTRLIELLTTRCDGAEEAFLQRRIARPLLPVPEFRSTRRPISVGSLKFRLAVVNFVDQTGGAGALVKTLADALTTGLYTTERFDLLDRGQLREKGTSVDDIRKLGLDVRPDGILQGAITQIRPQEQVIVCDLRVTNTFSEQVVFATSAEIRYTGTLDIRLDRDDVTRLTTQIADSFPRADEREPIRIAQISGQDVTLAGGADRSVRAGMVGLVMASSDLTRDPDSGEVLQSHMYVGRLSVRSVEERTSVAQVHAEASFSPDVRVGDIIIFK